MSLLNQKNCTDEEFLVKYSLIYLGMKKIKDENIEKILNMEENK